MNATTVKNNGQDVARAAGAQVDAVTLKAEDFKQIKLNGVTYEVTAINGNQISLVGTGSKAIKGGFEIVSYTNNVNKGTAGITLKGTGDFGGSVLLQKTLSRQWFSSAFSTRYRMLGSSVDR